MWLNQFSLDGSVAVLMFLPPTLASKFGTQELHNDIVLLMDMHWLMGVFIEDSSRCAKCPCQWPGHPSLLAPVSSLVAGRGSICIDDIVLEAYWLLDTLH